MSQKEAIEALQKEVQILKADRDTLASAVKGINTVLFVKHVEIMVGIAMIDSLCKKIGVSEIDGKSPAEWYTETRKQAIRARLLICEDKDPELAALLQAQIDKAMGNTLWET